MPLFDIKITATVVVSQVEASDITEATTIIVQDLGHRFPPNTEILSEFTTTEDVTVY